MLTRFLWVKWMAMVGMSLFLTLGSSCQKKEAEKNLLMLDLLRQEGGKIYGDKAGLLRVAKLEAELRAMKIRRDHPRIFLSKELVLELKKRIPGHRSWKAVVAAADGGEMLDAAFVYQMSGEKGYGEKAIAAALAWDVEKEEGKHTKGRGSSRDAAVGLLALAYDWTYEAMGEDERKGLTEKLAKLAGLDKITDSPGRYDRTFHLEGWHSRHTSAWPELALAHHYPGAAERFKKRWSYGAVEGDAARLFAYLCDGSYVEGRNYHFPHAVERGIAEWFMILKSATGIDLVTGKDYPRTENAAIYQLYITDLFAKKLLFRGGDDTGICMYIPNFWQLQDNMLAATAQSSNPYLQWYLNHVQWEARPTLTTHGYPPNNIGPVFDVIYYDSHKPERSPLKANFEELPPTKIFLPGNQAFLRTGWGRDDVWCSFSAMPYYTFHNHYVVNDISIYRKGFLAPDSGIQWDCLLGDDHRGKYFAQDIAHNIVLVEGGVDRFTEVANFGRGEGCFLREPKNQWGRILAFHSEPTFDYVASDGTRAYASRLNEYLRQLVFLRKGTSAYIVIFDRVVLKEPDLGTKWLLHLTAEPKVEGKLIDAQVKGHIETYKADKVEAKNAQGTSKITCVTLLPGKHTITRIGGNRGDATAKSIEKYDNVDCTRDPETGEEFRWRKGKVWGNMFIVIYRNDKAKGEKIEPAIGIMVFSPQRVRGAQLTVDEKGMRITYGGKVHEVDFAQARTLSQVVERMNRQLSSEDMQLVLLAGYEWWVDGKNMVVPERFGGGGLCELPFATGSPVEENGAWRIEVNPEGGGKRRLFLHVLYAGEPDDSIAPVKLVSEEDKVGVSINDPEIPSQILFKLEGEATAIVDLQRRGRKTHEVIKTDPRWGEPISLEKETGLERPKEEAAKTEVPLAEGKQKFVLADEAINGLRGQAFNNE